MITETRTRARTGRYAVLWYRDETDRAARFPVLLANQHGVFTARDVDPADIPAEARARAAAAHQAIAAANRRRRADRR